MFDVFFISYGEACAEENWQKLLRFAPTARRTKDVQGIHAAHRACAEKARTDSFYVVDADCEIINQDFTFVPASHDLKYVHLWYSRNPVNGLEYGWGGVKLFSRQSVLAMSSNTLDMTTNFEIKVVPVTTSINRFDSSALATWRSAFRECAKLSQNNDDESKMRLNIWCSVAAGPMAELCLAGANAGRDFGTENSGDRDALRAINDYSWLAARFREYAGRD